MIQCTHKAPEARRERSNAVARSKLTLAPVRRAVLRVPVDRVNGHGRAARLALDHHEGRVGVGVLLGPHRVHELLLRHRPARSGRGGRKGPLGRGERGGAD